MIFLLLNTISICLMIVLTGILSNEIKNMKYSFYYVMASYAFRGDMRAFNWLCRHKYYLWYFALIVTLVCTGLTQIGMMFENSIFTKPLFVFMVSPFLWLAILFIFIGHIKRINQTK